MSEQGIILPEPIINPAPPSANVNNNVPLVDKEKEKQDKNKECTIRDLTRELRIINNICDPICEYNKFQQSINPELRVLIDINQWVGLIYMLKSAIKSQIDTSYMDIEDPPEVLKEAMLKTYNSMDHASQSIENSMKEIINLIQSGIYSKSSCNTSNPISVTKCETKTDILKEMSSNSRLP